MKNHVRYSVCVGLCMAPVLLMPFNTLATDSVVQSSVESVVAEDTPAVYDLPIEHELEFGGSYLKMTIDEFNALGFEYGDSLTLTFSNGYVLDDLPYYNGYYANTGEPLLVAYPGYPYIKAAISNGEDLWGAAQLDDTCTASITLKERGAYKEVQEVRDIHYTDAREDYASDEVFANFRAMNMGNLKDNILYRSASPCDNKHNRASYVDELASKAGIQCILNLADDEAKIEEYLAADDFNSPYFKSVYDEGNVLLLAMNMDYTSAEFRQKLADGLTAMAEKDGPYLVHCTEGKDRTGFVCIVLEALTGASYDEIADDYMLTYGNYYNVTEETDPEKYEAILRMVFEPMIETIVGSEAEDMTPEEISEVTKAYLLDSGMQEDVIEGLIQKLCK